MTDFKIGDRVRVLSINNSNSNFWVGREFDIREVPYAGLFDVLLDAGDDGLPVRFDEIERVEPVPPVDDEPTVTFDDDDFDSIVAALMYGAQFTEYEDQAIKYLRVLRKINGID